MIKQQQCLASSATRIVVLALLCGTMSVSTPAQDTPPAAPERATAAGGSNAANTTTQPYSRAGADTCLGCHDDDVTLAIFKNAHGVRGDSRSPFGHGQLQCESCHGPGGNHGRRVPRGQERPHVVEFGKGATTPVSIQNQMCSGCHQTDLGAGWHGGAHAESEVACADCHTSHTQRDRMLTTQSQSEACGTCHTTTRLEHHKAFAHPLDQGKMTCSSCHDAHGSTNEASLVRVRTNDTCYECHADKRGPFLWEHAPVAEDCTSCHAPHGSNHLGMLKQRGPMLCQNCHSEQGHPSIAPTPQQSLPGGPRAPYVLGMNCTNCHSRVHGSNHPSGSRLMR